MNDAMLAESSAGVASSLVYSGVTIRDRGEMLSLTDMWRAAGSAPSKRPAEWLRSAAATDFIDYVVGDVGISHHEAIQVVRAGPDTATWAHWQIAFAYESKRRRLPGRQQTLFG